MVVVAEQNTDKTDKKTKTFIFGRCLLKANSLCLKGVALELELFVGASHM